MQGEYRGDFSRDTFRRANHFCRVLMQQGRVQLDADWNEQTSILLHYLRSLGRDLIGQHGGPGPSPGFAINQISSLSGDFQIGAGHYYVDGILCELDLPSLLVAVQRADNPNQVQVPRLTLDGVEFSSGQWVEFLDPTTGEPQDPAVLVPVSSLDSVTQTLTLKTELPSNLGGQLVPMRRVVTYLTQPELPEPDSLGTASSGVASFLVFLEVWERHLTCVETGMIREVALGGPDTASRARVISQVKIIGTQPDNTPIPPAQPDGGWRAWVNGLWPQWMSEWQGPNRGLLKAQVQPQATSTDPCITSPKSSYRGTENQLYRVEIHNGGPLDSGNMDTAPARAGAAPVTAPSGPSFKWSRENGSVVFPILSLVTSAGQTTVALANLGRDNDLSLKINDWVEVVDDDFAVMGVVDLLLQVQSIDPVNRIVILAGSSNIAVDKPPTKHPTLRRWDGIGQISESNGNLPANWIDLEDGIQIQFQPPPTGFQPNQYRSGDYWLLPARVATGDIEWPKLKANNGKPIPDSKGNPIPDALPPHGIEHHYAPLAIVTVDSGNVTGTTDLRRTFGPLATPNP